MLNKIIISIFISERRGLWLPLFFFVSFFSFSVQAQVEQKPQLETGPPAGPTSPTNRPVPPVTAPDTIKRKPVQPAAPLADKSAETADAGEEKPSFLSKLFVGGSGTLGFNSIGLGGQNYSLFNAGASPLLGYRLNKIVAVGPGVVFNYISINGNSFSEHGVKAFTQVTVYKMFLAHAEHELLSSQNFSQDSNGNLRKTDRFTQQTTLLGGAYRQMASDRFGFDLYVLFNVANNSGLSSNAPVIRAGVIYNLGK